MKKRTILICVMSLIVASLTGCNIGYSKAEKVEITDEIISNEVTKAINIIYTGRIDSIYLDEYDRDYLVREYERLKSKGNQTEWDISNILNEIYLDISNDIIEGYMRINNIDVATASNAINDNQLDIPSDTSYEDILAIIDKVKDEKHSYGPEFYATVNEDLTINKNELCNLILESTKGNIKYITEDDEFILYRSNPEIKEYTTELCGRRIDITFPTNINTLMNNSEYQYKVYEFNKLENEMFDVKVTNGKKNIALSVQAIDGKVNIHNIIDVLDIFSDFDIFRISFNNKD